MSILGNRVQRIEDVRFLLGQERYVANIAPPDADDSTKSMGRHRQRVSANSDKRVF